MEPSSVSQLAQLYGLLFNGLRKKDLCSFYSGASVTTTRSQHRVRVVVLLMFPLIVPKSLFFIESSLRDSLSPDRVTRFHSINKHSGTGTSEWFPFPVLYLIVCLVA